MRLLQNTYAAALDFNPAFSNRCFFNYYSIVRGKHGQVSSSFFINNLNV